MALNDYEIIVYDCEVFAYDWLFVFKDYKSGEYTSFWNDPDGLAEFMEENEEAVFAGFNNKHYDQYILKAIVAGCDPEQVKEVNDWIIGTDNQPWEHPYLNGFFYKFHNTDLMDDTQKGTSLKSIEGHLGMGIEESTVDFRIEKKLTKKQRAEVEKYCRHDVDATTELLKIRWDYLETKLHLAGLADIDPYDALGMTDPKLAAALFGADQRYLQAGIAQGIEDRLGREAAELASEDYLAYPADYDERDYRFPDRLDYDLVPDEVVAFFKRIADTSIDDEELFSSTLECEIGGCPVVYAFGGIHGALPKHKERAGNGRILLNYDVSSLYPSLMIEYGYVSRAVPNPDIFKGIRSERFAAKKSGDKVTANALKSPMNKAYGAMGNPYNAMYDPKNKLSVCVSGQLSITELAAVYASVDGLRIIQLNTDGVMISIPEERYDEVIAINEWWQNQTALELEEDRVEFVWQKDVNNYAMRKTDGSEKVKGAYLVRGISPIGAWSINNNAVIVAEALKRYLLDGTPVAQTINACDDPMAFQLIAKVGHKYSEVYQLVLDESSSEGETWVKAPVQKCNRVFATRDGHLGRLYKVKAADGSVAKVESLPDHCLICNDKPPSILNIDKSYYIQLAEKRARDFKEEKKLATTAKTSARGAAAKPVDYSGMNVYKKLSLARKMFMDTNPKKSGTNDHAEYDYFELEDIVPEQTRIFNEVGLLEVFRFEPSSEISSSVGSTGETSTLTIPALAKAEVINCDNPDDTIEFQLAWGEVPPILNSKGKEVNNDIQRKGGEQTYMRRYLKMQVLDIAEHDEVDSTNWDEAASNAAKAEAAEKKAPSASRKPAAKKPAAPRKPATASERKSAAAKVTDADGAATTLQLRNLKKNIKVMVDKYGDEHPEVAQYVAELSAKTGKLKTITKREAEAAIQKLGEMKAGYESEGNEE
ncbi:ERF family protein [Adlercreutzia sp. ZJ242]|uniref:ERF family protein n=1 Tax=Adlercreutzia sp. ZJ242 TaxID=2709409 RepID=UPI0013EA0860|nr:ERF family protein [Adlercreutzia sp. ZJ242]